MSLLLIFLLRYVVQHPLLRWCRWELRLTKRFKQLSIDIISKDLLWITDRLPCCCPCYCQHDSGLFLLLPLRLTSSSYTLLTPSFPCIRVRRKWADGGWACFMLQLRWSHNDLEIIRFVLLHVSRRRCESAASTSRCFSSLMKPSRLLQNVVSVLLLRTCRWSKVPRGGLNQAATLIRVIEDTVGWSVRELNL